ncbi:hypothetical protein PVK06_034686 [Gossypium arboreum]|uniref:Uncharacterized protein n=1 Tax=Gossypium arboreum TaxID=29729 RepID=A0ABR0NFY1_GOSAR|nr:hypothetical protein PVK06_034686 [Gossypium arboreum]
MLQFVPSLEELLVDDCEAADEEITESCCISLKSLTLGCFPELVHIVEGAQTKVLFEYITVYDYPQLKQIESAIGSDFEAIFKEVEE